MIVSIVEVCLTRVSRHRETDDYCFEVSGNPGQTRRTSFFHMASKALSTRIRIFFNPQLFPSGYENIRVHTLCDHSVFKSNSPVHTYSDSLRIDQIVPPGTGTSRSNPESSRMALLSCSSKLFLLAVLCGRQRKELADVKPPSGITYFSI